MRIEKRGREKERIHNEKGRFGNRRIKGKEIKGERNEGWQIDIEGKKERKKTSNYVEK